MKFILFVHHARSEFSCVFEFAGEKIAMSARAEEMSE